MGAEPARAAAGGRTLEALLSAGEELRAAQEELLAGGDRAGVPGGGGPRARPGGEARAPTPPRWRARPASAARGLQEKVAATLHAAALDEETAEELRAGRLVKEREAIGGFGEEGGGEVPARAPKKRPAKRSPRRSQPAPQAQTADRKGERQAQQARQARQARRSGRRCSVARTGERHARRELETAERAVQHAQERAEAAEAHAKEANERARTTADRLKEAKRAQTAARRAHAQRRARPGEGRERRLVTLRGLLRLPNGRLTAPREAPPRIRNTNPEEDHGTEGHDEDDHDRGGMRGDRNRRRDRRRVGGHERQRQLRQLRAAPRTTPDRARPVKAGIRARAATSGRTASGGAAHRRRGREGARRRRSTRSAAAPSSASRPTRTTARPTRRTSAAPTARSWRSW